MRVSSIVLFLLAAITVTSSGCKVGNKRGVSATRVASRNVVRRESRDRSATSALAARGTAECDCYTCRMKRQSNPDYMIDSVYEPMNVTPNQESTEPTILSPVVDSNIVQPQLVTPDLGVNVAEENTKLRPLPVDPPVQQEIQGQVISDEELTNELPTEPEVDAQSEIPSIPEAIEQLEIRPESKPDVQPKLISPQTSFQLMRDRNEFKPLVRSAPIEAKKVSVAMEESQPVVNESVFKLKSRHSSAIDTDQQVETPKSRRGHSIWFAPVKRQDNESTAPRSTPVRPAPVRTQPPQQASAPVIIPTIEHDVQEIKQPKVNDSIVLKARPVDRHLIYNSRPVHAPAREARLPENSRYAMSHRQPTQDQTYFHPLPPEDQRWMSPAPAPVTPLPTANSQSGSQFVQPLPKQQDDSAQLRLKANAIQPGNQTSGSQPALTPMARVIKPNSPMLKLKAVQAGAEPQMLPSIVSIQRQQQDRVIVGSLQPPRSQSRDVPATSYGQDMNRLHTTPWQPMQTGKGGDQQVQQSIRQLMIKPQQEANFATDGIHR